MAALGSTFDPNAVAPAAPREILPPGDYLVHIVASEMKPTKDGGGQYLQLEFAVIDGQFANRKLFVRLNLINANATAVEIANRDLADICLATNSGIISDSEQLHWKPMLVTVKVEPPKGQYAASNSVSAYKATGGQRVQQPAHTQSYAAPAAPVQTTAARPATGGVQPWRRHAASAA